MDGKKVGWLLACKMTPPPSNRISRLEHPREHYRSSTLNVFKEIVEGWAPISFQVLLDEITLETVRAERWAYRPEVI